LARRRPKEHGKEKAKESKGKIKPEAGKGHTHATSKYIYNTAQGQHSLKFKVHPAGGTAQLTSLGEK
jgi:hypothetical protein